MKAKVIAFRSVQRATLPLSLFDNTVICGNEYSAEDGGRANERELCMGVFCMLSPLIYL